MRVPQQPSPAFVPLTDDEIMLLFEQGLGHLLRPYCVGLSCEHRGSNPAPLPIAQWTPAAQDWPAVA